MKTEFLLPFNIGQIITKYNSTTYESSHWAIIQTNFHKEELTITKVKYNPDSGQWVYENHEDREKYKFTPMSTFELEKRTDEKT